VKIKEILELTEKRELPLVNEHDTIREVLEKMLKHFHTRLMYVVDKDGTCVGIISLGSLIRHLFSSSFEPSIHARGLIPMITSETAEHMMNKGLVYATAEDAVETVIRQMVTSDVKEIPILDEKRRIVGDITMLDLLKYYYLRQE
jgi:CBS domain-containing protein